MLFLRGVRYLVCIISACCARVGRVSFLDTLSFQDMPCLIETPVVSCGWYCDHHFVSTLFSLANATGGGTV